MTPAPSQKKLSLALGSTGPCSRSDASQAESISLRQIVGGDLSVFDIELHHADLLARLEASSSNSWDYFSHSCRAFSSFLPTW